MSVDGVDLNEIDMSSYDPAALNAEPRSFLPDGRLAELERLAAQVQSSETVDPDIVDRLAALTLEAVQSVMPPTADAVAAVAEVLSGSSKTAAAALRAALQQGLDAVPEGSTGWLQHARQCVVKVTVVQSSIERVHTTMETAATHNKNAQKLAVNNPERARLLALASKWQEEADQLSAYLGQLTEEEQAKSCHIMGRGSGAVFSEDGKIVTAAHVVRQWREGRHILVSVRDPNTGQMQWSHTAKVVTSPELREQTHDVDGQPVDVAVLQINGTAKTEPADMRQHALECNALPDDASFPHLEICDTTNICEGEDMWMLGYPGQVRGLMEDRQVHPHALLLQLVVWFTSLSSSGGVHTARWLVHH